jgi:hypothetical protein
MSYNVLFAKHHYDDKIKEDEAFSIYTMNVVDDKFLVGEPEDKTPLRSRRR